MSFTDRRFGICRAELSLYFVCSRHRHTGEEFQQGISVRLFPVVNTVSEDVGGWAYVL